MNVTPPTPDPTDIAAELAALGEADLAVDEAAWLTAQSTRLDSVPAAGTPEVPAHVQAAELSQHSLQRVWGRLERRWWSQRVYHHLRDAWLKVRDIVHVSPHHVAWTTAAVAVVTVGIHSVEWPSGTQRTDDDDLAALGA